MFRMSRVLGGALVAVALLAGSIVHAEDEKPVLLIVKPKVGRVIRIKTVVNTSVAGTDLVIHETQKNTVKTVKANGDVVVEIVGETSTISTGGQTQNQPLTPPYSIVRDKLGKIKEGRKIEKDEFMSMEISKLNEALSGFFLTDREVKPNDTWETELENPAVRDRKITVKDTYLGLEKVDGKDYWKIKQTSEAVVSVTGNKMSYDAVEWVNPADGTTFKVETTVKDVPTPAGLLTLKIAAQSVAANDKSN